MKWLKFIGKATRRFSLSLIDIQAENIPTPNIDFKSSVKMTTDTLRQAIEDAQIISDHIKLAMEGEVLTLKAIGDTGEVEIKLEKDNDSVLSVETQENSSATYSLEYLNDIMKGASTSNIVELSFATNMPIKIMFPIEKGGITYYLAPRVEAE
ncbi:MAG: hypothetical protein QW739_03520 [Candidatus Odinarchaeota archaeon]